MSTRTPNKSKLCEWTRIISGLPGLGDLDRQRESWTLLRHLLRTEKGEKTGKAKEIVTHNLYFTATQFFYLCGKNWGPERFLYCATPCITKINKNTENDIAVLFVVTTHIFSVSVTSTLYVALQLHILQDHIIRVIHFKTSLHNVFLKRWEKKKQRFEGNEVADLVNFIFIH